MRYGIALALAFAVLPAASQAATIDTFNCAGTSVQATLVTAQAAAVSVAGGAAQTLKIELGEARGSVQFNHSITLYTYVPAALNKIHDSRFVWGSTQCKLVSSK